METKRSEVTKETYNAKRVDAVIPAVKNALPGELYRISPSTFCIVM